MTLSIALSVSCDVKYLGTGSLRCINVASGLNLEIEFKKKQAIILCEDSHTMELLFHLFRCFVVSRLLTFGFVYTWLTLIMDRFHMAYKCFSSNQCMLMY